MRVVVRITDRRGTVSAPRPALARANTSNVAVHVAPVGCDDAQDSPDRRRKEAVEEEKEERHGPKRDELRLCVLEAMQLRQLRDLVAMQLATRQSSSSRVAEDVSPPRPKTAPASASGRLAAGLAVAAGVGNGRSGGPTSAQQGPPRFQPAPRGRPREQLALQLVFNGRLLGAEDEERALGDLGVADGATLHCLVSVKAKQVDAQQELSCYPRHCSIDGGRVVHVLGSRFPSSSRLVCRFGTILVGAELEDDGEEGGISQLRTLAPPHPAGAVTIGVSFDGGATWLGGPTFWYVDPSQAACPHGIAVPAQCGATIGVKVDATFGGQLQRWDHGGPDPGSGCA
mmetsp:Transcript_33362/g.94274  ORF Transcript_33362/g.94274 Transcript_33362/m.94274 type:complete len:342 (+) Transcript_33362:36-1061(+)